MPGKKRQTYAERERQAREAVDTWNTRHAKGELVEYLDFPSARWMQYRTTSAAFALSNHTACIMFEGRREAAELRHVREVAVVAGR